jgi:ribosomal protein L40E
MSDFERNLARAEKAVSVFCTACGTANPADARYCKACGKRLEEFYEEAESAKPPSAQPKAKPAPKAAKPLIYVSPEAAKVAERGNFGALLVRVALIVIGGIIVYNVLQPLIGLAIFVLLVWGGISLFRRLTAK